MQARSIAPVSAIGSDEACADNCATGFWDRCQQDFFVHPNLKTQPTSLSL